MATDIRYYLQVVRTGEAWGYALRCTDPEHLKQFEADILAAGFTKTAKGAYAITTQEVAYGVIQLPMGVRSLLAGTDVAIMDNPSPWVVLPENLQVKFVANAKPGLAPTTVIASAPSSSYQALEYAGFKRTPSGKLYLATPDGQPFQSHADMVDRLMQVSRIFASASGYDPKTAMLTLVPYSQVVGAEPYIRAPRTFDIPYFSAFAAPAVEAPAVEAAQESPEQEVATAEAEPKELAKATPVAATIDNLVEPVKSPGATEIPALAASLLQTGNSFASYYRSPNNVRMLLVAVDGLLERVEVLADAGDGELEASSIIQFTDGKVSEVTARLEGMGIDVNLVGQQAENQWSVFRTQIERDRSPSFYLYEGGDNKREAILSWIKELEVRRDVLTAPESDAALDLAERTDAAIATESEQVVVAPGPVVIGKNLLGETVLQGDQNYIETPDGIEAYTGMAGPNGIAERMRFLTIDNEAAGPHTASIILAALAPSLNKLEAGGVTAQGVEQSLEPFTGTGAGHSAAFSQAVKTVVSVLNNKQARDLIESYAPVQSESALSNLKDFALLAESSVRIAYEDLLNAYTQTVGSSAKAAVEARIGDTISPEVEQAAAHQQQAEEAKAETDEVAEEAPADKPVDVTQANRIIDAAAKLVRGYADQRRMEQRTNLAVPDLDTDGLMKAIIDNDVLATGEVDNYPNLYAYMERESDQGNYPFTPEVIQEVRRSEAQFLAAAMPTPEPEDAKDDATFDLFANDDNLEGTLYNTRGASENDNAMVPNDQEALGRSPAGESGGPAVQSGGSGLAAESGGAGSGGENDSGNGRIEGGQRDERVSGMGADGNQVYADGAGESAEGNERGTVTQLEDAGAATPEQDGIASVDSSTPSATPPNAVTFIQIAAETGTETVYRSDNSNIVEWCHAIRSGEPFVDFAKVEINGDRGQLTAYLFTNTGTIALGYESSKDGPMLYAGLNADGERIYVNKDGVRSKQEVGTPYISTEPVAVAPRRNGVEASISNEITRDRYRIAAPASESQITLLNPVRQVGKDGMPEAMPQTIGGIWLKARIRAEELVDLAVEQGKGDLLKSAEFYPDPLSLMSACASPEQLERINQEFGLDWKVSPAYKGQIASAVQFAISHSAEQALEVTEALYGAPASDAEATAEATEATETAEAAEATETAEAAEAAEAAADTAEVAETEKAENPSGLQPIPLGETNYYGEAITKFTKSNVTPLAYELAFDFAGRNSPEALKLGFEIQRELVDKTFPPSDRPELYDERKTTIVIKNPLLGGMYQVYDAINKNAITVLKTHQEVLDRAEHYRIINPHTPVTNDKPNLLHRDPYDLLHRFRTDKLEDGWQRIKRIGGTEIAAGALPINMAGMMELDRIAKIDEIARSGFHARHWYVPSADSVVIGSVAIQEAEGILSNNQFNVVITRRSREGIESALAEYAKQSGGIKNFSVTADAYIANIMLVHSEYGLLADYDPEYKSFHFQDKSGLFTSVSEKGVSHDKAMLYSSSAYPHSTGLLVKDNWLGSQKRYKPYYNLTIEKMPGHEVNPHQFDYVERLVEVAAGLHYGQEELAKLGAWTNIDVEKVIENIQAKSNRGKVPEHLSKRISIIDVSDKSFVVTGDVDTYKEYLGANGLRGRFVNGSETQYSGYKGWAFPQSRRIEVTQAMQAFPANPLAKIALTLDVAADTDQTPGLPVIQMPELGLSAEKVSTLLDAKDAMIKSIHGSSSDKIRHQAFPVLIESMVLTKDQVESKGKLDAIKFIVNDLLAGDPMDLLNQGKNIPRSSSMKAYKPDSSRTIGDVVGGYLDINIHPAKPAFDKENPAAVFVVRYPLPLPLMDLPATETNLTNLQLDYCNTLDASMWASHYHAAESLIPKPATVSKAIAQWEGTAEDILQLADDVASINPTLADAIDDAYQSKATLVINFRGQSIRIDGEAGTFQYANLNNAAGRPEVDLYTMNEANIEKAYGTIVRLQARRLGAALKTFETNSILKGYGTHPELVSEGMIEAFKALAKKDQPLLHDFEFRAFINHVTPKATTDVFKTITEAVNARNELIEKLINRSGFVEESQQLVDSVWPVIEQGNLFKVPTIQELMGDTDYTPDYEEALRKSDAYRKLVDQADRLSREYEEVLSDIQEDAEILQMDDQYGNQSITGMNLPPRFVQIINTALEQAEVPVSDAEEAGILTVHFKSPKYSINGGYRPVEVGIMPNGEIAYVTDYTYYQDGFLDRGVDFDFASNAIQIEGHRQSMTDFAKQDSSFMRMYFSNFVDYVQHDVFKVSFSNKSDIQYNFDGVTLTEYTPEVVAEVEAAAEVEANNTDQTEASADQQQPAQRADIEWLPLAENGKSYVADYLAEQLSRVKAGDWVQVRPAYGEESRLMQVAGSSPVGVNAIVLMNEKGEPQAYPYKDIFPGPIYKELMQSPKWELPSQALLSGPDLIAGALDVSSPDAAAYLQQKFPSFFNELLQDYVPSRDYIKLTVNNTDLEALCNSISIVQEEKLPIGLAVIEAFLQKDREEVARLGQAQANIVTDMARAGVLDAFNIAGNLSREEQKQLLSMIPSEVIQQLAGKSLTGETSKFVSGKYFDSKPMLYVNGKTGSVYGFEDENANKPLVAGITLNYDALAGLILNASDIREQYSVDLFQKAVAEYESGNHQNGPASVYRNNRIAARSKRDSEKTANKTESAEIPVSVGAAEALLLLNLVNENPDVFASNTEEIKAGLRAANAVIKRQIEAVEEKIGAGLVDAFVFDRDPGYEIDNEVIKTLFAEADGNQLTNLVQKANFAEIERFLGLEPTDSPAIYFHYDEDTKEAKCLGLDDGQNSKGVIGVSLNASAFPGLILSATELSKHYSPEQYEQAYEEYLTGNMENGPVGVYKRNQEKGLDASSKINADSLNESLSDRGWLSIRPNTEWPKIRHGVTLHPEYRSVGGDKQIAGIRVSSEQSEIKTVVGNTNDDVKGQSPADVLADNIDHQINQDFAPNENSQNEPLNDQAGAGNDNDEPYELADDIADGGIAAKFDRNIAAITLLKELERAAVAAGRKSTDIAPTKEQKDVLARYVGWGGMPQAFKKPNGTYAKGWEQRGRDLEALLSKEELEAAKRSTTNAHYTAVNVVDAIYAGVKRLGVRDQFKMLEPSIGTGNFIGRMPGDLRANMKLVGVELDSLTGRIANGIYGDNDNRIAAGIGYEEFYAEAESFDLVVANPPFGNYKVFDRNLPGLSSSIHNFFTLKSNHLLRAGGVHAFVISRYFMDAINPNVREQVAKEMKFLGAMRLPETAFKENANTEVVTDVVFLQKRDVPLKEIDFTDPEHAWVTTKKVLVEQGALEEIAIKTPGDSKTLPVYEDHPALENKIVHINSHFVNNPDMALGDFVIQSSQHGPVLSVTPNGDLNTQMARFIETLPEGVYDPAKSVLKNKNVIKRELIKFADIDKDLSNVGIGTMFTYNGAVYERLNDIDFEAVAQEVKTRIGSAGKEIKLSALDTKRLYAMIEMRETRDLLVKAEREGEPDSHVETLRKRLGEQYDAFFKVHGPINNSRNTRLIRQDSGYIRMTSLEKNYSAEVKAEKTKGNKKILPRPEFSEKADIFFERVIRQEARVTKAESPSDALAHSLSETGGVDMEYMAGLLSGRYTHEQILDDLKNDVFVNPLSGEYETAAKYLSGNVRRKLKEAELAAHNDPAFQRNVDALLESQPQIVPFEEIGISFGAHWTPPSIYSDFIRHLAKSHRTSGRAVIDQGAGRWHFMVERESSEIMQNWSLSGVNFVRVMTSAATNKPITVTYKDNQGKTVTDTEKSLQANQIVDKLKMEYASWLRDSDERRELMEAAYNEQVNNTVRPDYTAPENYYPKGIVDRSVLSLNKNQIDYAFRSLQTNSISAVHFAGAGKTIAETVATMEQIRTGQIRKALAVVPNHLTGQWAAEVQRIYPSAKLLVAEKEDFTKERREKLFGRIATGNWDMVIIGHSQLIKLPIDYDIQQEFINKEIENLEETIRMMDSEGAAKYTVKRMETQKMNLEAKLTQSMADQASFTGVALRDMGIDKIIVDEAHNFKNLGFASELQVTGMGSREGSQKASNLLVHATHVRKEDGKYASLSATPLSNSISEMYNFLRFNNPEALEDKGLYSYDAFINLFAEVETRMELSMTGDSYRLVSRLSKFKNIPELLDMYLEVADCVTPSAVKAAIEKAGGKWFVPTVRSGGSEVIAIPQTPEQIVIYGELRNRIEVLEDKNTFVDPRIDNKLKVLSDARKAALHPRMFDPDSDEYYVGKLKAGVEFIGRETARMIDQVGEPGLHIVFCDIGVPKHARGQERERVRALQHTIETTTGEKAEQAQKELEKYSPDELLSIMDDSDFTFQDAMRTSLTEKLGIPAERIASLHDCKNDDERMQLFSRCNNGEVTVLFATTSKGGEGMNVSKKAAGVLHIDVPWRPSDLEQRRRRAERQGNSFFEKDQSFEVYNTFIVVEQSTDAWQLNTVESKAGALNMITYGRSNAREAEDIGMSEEEYAAIKAVASGSDIVKRQHEAQVKVKGIINEIQAQRDKISRYRSTQRKFDSNLPHYEKRIAELEKAISTIAEYPSDKVTIEEVGEDGKVAKRTRAAMHTKLPDGRIIEDRMNAGMAILFDAVRATKGGGGADVHIATVKGVDISVDPSSLSKNKLLGDCYELTFKVGDYEETKEYALLGKNPKTFGEEINNVIEGFERSLTNYQYMHRQLKAEHEEFLKMTPPVYDKTLDGQLAEAQEEERKIMAEAEAEKQAPAKLDDVLGAIQSMTDRYKAILGKKEAFDDLFNRHHQELTNIADTIKEGKPVGRDEFNKQVVQTSIELRSAKSEMGLSIQKIMADELRMKVMAQNAIVIMNDEEASDRLSDLLGEYDWAKDFIASNERAQTAIRGFSDAITHDYDAEKGITLDEVSQRIEVVRSIIDRELESAGLEKSVDPEDLARQTFDQINKKGQDAINSNDDPEPSEQPSLI